jgi:hypothetical protein
LGVRRAVVGVLLLRARRQLRDLLTEKGELRSEPWVGRARQEGKAL